MLRSPMRVAMAQINQPSATSPATRERIIDAVAAGRRARRAPGGHARALALRLSARRPACCVRPSCDACARELAALAARMAPRTASSVGFPRASATARSLQRGLGAARGRVAQVYASASCPTTGVRRAALFRAGRRARGLRGRRHALRPDDLRGRLVRGAGRAAEAAGAQVLVRAQRVAVPPRASRRARGAHGRARAREMRLPLLYANLVGGQDEIVFDGASFALDASGALVAQGRRGTRPWRSSSSTAARRARVRGSLDAALEARSERAGHGRARLRRQERLSRRAHRAVGRHRLGARCWRSRSTRSGAERVRAVMMPSPLQPPTASWIDARDMAARWACATTRSRSSRCSRPSAPPGAEFRGLAGGRDRGEHPGPHPRHAADGAVEQVRLDRADHRQQERDGDRLLHAVRRHGGRLRGASRTWPRRWSTGCCALAQRRARAA